MSSAPTNLVPADGPEPVMYRAPDGPSGATRTFTQQALYDTFRRASARIGLTWLLVVLAGAMLSPLLCSSFPLLVKINGRWSSPLISHLNKGDVVIVAAGATAVVLAMLRRFSLSRRVLIFMAIVAVTGVLSVLFVQPRITDSYSKYRQLAAAGALGVKIDTLIPFSINDRLRDQSDMFFHAPDHVHWMGTDESGADVLSGMLHGCQIALAVGFISTGIALVIGCAIGAAMGYFAGMVDLIGMRAIEIVSAIPTLFLLLMLSAVAGPYAHNLYLIMTIIGLTGWDGYARFVRAEFLKLRQQDFVQSAVASGLPLRSVLFRHMLPNALSPVLVSASFGVASAILTESTLSFLGLGLIDEPSWGRLLNQALGEGGNFHWWLATYPGLAIFLTVFAYNLVGESLRDAVDPKLRR
jgi:peptide/nickel transport system permease protein